MIGGKKYAKVMTNVLYVFLNINDEIAANKLSKPGRSIKICDLRKHFPFYPQGLWISYITLVVPPTGIEPVSHA